MDQSRRVFFSSLPFVCSFPCKNCLDTLGFGMFDLAGWRKASREDSFMERHSSDFRLLGMRTKATGH